MKKISSLLLTGILSFSMGTAVFAQETVIDLKEKSGLNHMASGTRQAEVKDIVINEAGAGVFKKNKKIYLQANHLQFEKGTTVEVTNGDIKVKDIEVDKDTLILTIDRESTEPSVITLKNVKLYLNDMLPTGTYSIDLITEESEDYPDNVFGVNYGNDSEKGKFPTKSVVLMDDFATVSSIEKQALKKQVVIRPEENTITVDGNIIPISQPAYLSEKGYLMIPIRTINQALPDIISVTWADETKTATLIIGADKAVTMQVGSSTMVSNGVSIVLQGEVEMKNDSVYLPFRDLGYALGCNDDNILWDAETQTATFQFPL